MTYGIFLLSLKNDNAWTLTISVITSLSMFFCQLSIFHLRYTSIKGAVHNYEHHHKCTKIMLFLTPPPPLPTSPKCTTKNDDFIIKKFILRKH